MFGNTGWRRYAHGSHGRPWCRSGPDIGGAGFGMHGLFGHLFRHWAEGMHARHDAHGSHGGHGGPPPWTPWAHGNPADARYGQCGPWGSGPSRDQMIQWLERYQRDLQDEAATVAARLNELREAGAGTAGSPNPTPTPTPPASEATPPGETRIL
ncbi:MAG: hypothetical protein AVDCRST_MAG77-32 [uncultured Chloroflexi bacterium]|uniref:DUF5320 domain-containing protein n=1 Tax=uncultured Chloroflexota bacterium TaxID=166587 RepID=A0A6J4H4L6_9CHLR|nr:MAG: hypothetical protein AVDCRST_MAG77-32 [uncultured Chloroflexota bacterium]